MVTTVLKDDDVSHYLQNHTLYKRLIDCCEALLTESNKKKKIQNIIDGDVWKLKASLTMFLEKQQENTTIQQVLSPFFFPT